MKPKFTLLALLALVSLVVPAVGIGAAIAPVSGSFRASGAQPVHAAGFSGHAGGFLPAVGDGGYDFWMPQTPEGAALLGAAQVIAAQGRYNQATSAAAIQATNAESRELGNQPEGVRTFYQMREAGRIARENERAPGPTAQEIARRSHAAAPRAVTSDQVDPNTGGVDWPRFLRDPSFEKQRAAIENCTANWVRNGELADADRGRMRENINTLFKSLKSRAAMMPPQEYAACRSFLESLLYSTTKSQL